MRHVKVGSRGGISGVRVGRYAQGWAIKGRHGIDAATFQKFKRDVYPTESGEKIVRVIVLEEHRAETRSEVA